MTLCSASALDIVDADVLLTDDSTGLEDLMDLYEAMGITSDQAHRSLSFLESMDALIEASVGIASLETFDDYAQDSDYAPEESAPSSDYAPESAPSSDYAPESVGRTCVISTPRYSHSDSCHRRNNSELPLETLPRAPPRIMELSAWVSRCSH